METNKQIIRIEVICVRFSKKGVSSDVPIAPMRKENQAEYIAGPEKTSTQSDSGALTCSEILA